MPLYLQILLLLVAFVIFVALILYSAGWGIRRVCFKIIADLEEARAFSPSKAITLQDERKNFFRVGTGNLRPKALNLLIQDGLVIKAEKSKYYLDREKLAEMRKSLQRP